MGACAGSTTGGIKSIRLVILAKVSRNEFKHIIHPNAVLPVRVNKQVISPSIRSTVFSIHFHTSTGENLPFLEEEYEVATENGGFQMNVGGRTIP